MSEVLSNQQFNTSLNAIQSLLGDPSVHKSSSAVIDVPSKIADHLSLLLEHEPTVNNIRLGLGTENAPEVLDLLRSLAFIQRTPSSINLFDTFIPKFATKVLTDSPEHISKQPKLLMPMYKLARDFQNAANHTGSATFSYLAEKIIADNFTDLLLQQDISDNEAADIIQTVIKIGTPSQVRQLVRLERMESSSVGRAV